MSRHFRPWTIDQARLLPAAVVDYVPADHLAQFVVALARERLDLSEIVASYKSGLGQPPFDPRMMTASLLYAYCSGLYSSRRIAKACAERVDFMMIVAHDAPDFRTIADFRKRHLPLCRQHAGHFPSGSRASGRPSTAVAAGQRGKLPDAQKAASVLPAAFRAEGAAAIAFKPRQRLTLSARARARGSRE